MTELSKCEFAEVPAATAERPEQIRVLGLAGVDQTSVGQHDVGAQHVVDCQAVLAGQIAMTPAQGQPADAGRRVDPADRRQAEGVGGVVDVTPSATALGPDGLDVRVDADAGHLREVDDEAVVDHREALAVMSAVDRDL